ncbi:MAG: hypothetical protein AAGU27_07885, partial [Dehalobacterium sp.]
ASFRFPVTRDTLAVRLMVPTTKSIADFHRRVTAHVGRTRNSPYRSRGHQHFCISVPLTVVGSITKTIIN